MERDCRDKIPKPLNYTEVLPRRLNALFIALICIGSFIPLQAREVPDSVFYNCFKSGEMARWKSQMESLASTPDIQNNLELLRRLAFAQYGYIGFLLENEKENYAANFLSALEVNLVQLGKLQPQNAEIMALHGAYYGLKISLQKWKAPSYGRKSMNYINTALELGPENGYVWSEKANMTYHMPSFVGGGVSSAIPFLEKAIELMETHPKKWSKNWLYLLSCSNLGKWYAENGQIDEARIQYQKIRQMAPGFIRVRDELLPALEHP